MTYKFFTKEDLKCKCGCGSTGDEMDHQMMQMLVMLRDDLGFAFNVTSAYRCPDHNEKVSSTGRRGRHTTGKAIDIFVRHEQALQLLSKAFDLGFTGIGAHQKGGARFIHLDTCNASDGYPNTAFWTY